MSLHFGGMNPFLLYYAAVKSVKGSLCIMVLIASN